MSEKKLTDSERAILSEKQKKFDGSASKDDCIEDLRQLQEYNPFKHITRNFYRINGKYSDSTWNRFFGTFLEFRRQSGLELSRGQHSLERQIAKHASADIYRDYYKTTVLPYHEKYSSAQRKPGRFKTVLVGSDFHDIEADPFVLSVFIDTAKRVQPDIIVLNGDVFDCLEFGKYTVDPRDIKIKERFEFVRQKIFKPLRDLCPNSQIDMIIGNHEYRILLYMADRSPALKVLLSDIVGLTLSQIFGLDEFKINLVAKLDLEAFSQNERKENLKENFKVYYDTFICCHFKDWVYGLSGSSGHTHRPELETRANIPMGKLSWTTTGCIAKTRAGYVQGMDVWTNSFMLAHIDTLKKIVSPEHFLIPGDFVVIHGKRYERKKHD